MQSFLANLIAAACIAACGAVVVQPLSAQSLWPVSLELTLGPGYIHAEEPADYVHQSQRGARAAVLIGFTAADLGPGHIVVATDIAAQGRGIQTSKAICYELPNGGCQPEIPDFRMLSILGGWESAGRGVRALAGPLYIYENGRGLQARVDGAVPVARRLALTAALSGVLARYQDARFQLVALGFGIRIQ